MSVVCDSCRNHYANVIEGTFEQSEIEPNGQILAVRSWSTTALPTRRGQSKTPHTSNGQGAQLPADVQSKPPFWVSLFKRKPEPEAELPPPPPPDWKNRIRSDAPPEAPPPEVPASLQEDAPATPTAYDSTGKWIPPSQAEPPRRTSGWVPPVLPPDLDPNVTAFINAPAEPAVQPITDAQPRGEFQSLFESLMGTQPISQTPDRNPTADTFPGFTPAPAPPAPVEALISQHDIDAASDADYAPAFAPGHHDDVWSYAMSYTDAEHQLDDSPTADGTVSPLPDESRHDIAPASPRSVLDALMPRDDSPDQAFAYTDHAEDDDDDAGGIAPAAPPARSILDDLIGRGAHTRDIPAPSPEPGSERFETKQTQPETPLTPDRPAPADSSQMGRDWQELLQLTGDDAPTVMQAQAEVQIDPTAGPKDWGALLDIQSGARQAATSDITPVTRGDRPDPTAPTEDWQQWLQRIQAETAAQAPDAAPEATAPATERQGWEPSDGQTDGPVVALSWDDVTLLGDSEAASSWADQEIAGPGAPAPADVALNKQPAIDIHQTTGWQFDLQIGNTPLEIERDDSDQDVSASRPFAASGPDWGMSFEIDRSDNDDDSDSSETPKSRKSLWDDIQSDDSDDDGQVVEL